MKKSKPSKMSLRKETIAVLEHVSLGQAVAGVFVGNQPCGPSNPAICGQPTQITCHLFYSCP